MNFEHATLQLRSQFLLDGNGKSDSCVVTGKFSMSVLDAEIFERYVLGSLSIDFNHVNGWTSESYPSGVDKRQINSKDNFVGCYE